MEGLKRAIEIAGSQAELASRINSLRADPSEHIRASAIGNWLMRGKVPAENVLDTCAAVAWQVKPHEIDSGIYPHADDGLPEPLRGTPPQQAAA